MEKAQVLERIRSTGLIPVIQATRFGGRAQISGGAAGFMPSEAQSLVTVLKFGSLPLEIREVGFSSISATLGLDFLNQTLLAGAIGIALVFAFMLLYYRVPGIVACLALIAYGVFALAIFEIVPITLTLAGIAAFILSVGMAVDANILIFERTKEELRSGTIYPDLGKIRQISLAIATSVCRLAWDEGLARYEQPDDIREYVRSCMWHPDYRPYVAA